MRGVREGRWVGEKEGVQTDKQEVDTSKVGGREGWIRGKGRRRRGNEGGEERTRREGRGK